MDELKLISPSTTYQAAYQKMLEDWNTTDEQKVPFTIRYEHQDFEALVKKLRSHEKGENLWEGGVPNSSFWLVNEAGEIVGTSNLRHFINERFERVGGHIGYGVPPSQRKKGYATKILALTLQIAKEKHQVKKALITCYTENIGSIKTILNNNGVFFKTEIVDERPTNFYWITLN